MDGQSNCLFITNVEKEGPFLKVWGQTDKNTSLYIEQVLHSFTAQFDNGLCIPQPDSLQIGILCCAKYKDNKYYRSRITSLNYLHNRYIEVNFVDYGHKDLVPISNIRSLEGFDTNFISIPPQANSFVLAQAVCPREEWNDAYLDAICKEIRYTEVTFTIIAQVAKHYLARLFVGINDLVLVLASKGLVRQTTLSTQEAVLLSRTPVQQVQQQPAMQQNIATYKAFSLEPGSQYEVYVSYVTDGPCNFSVQLKQSEEVLGKLMKEINSMTLTPIEGIPIPGTVCLARCSEDGHICRAVVTNEVDGQFKVFYVDFGNFEVIPLEAMYEIPFKFVIPKVMAIRFSLAGVEKSTVTLEMQCAFKQFVDNRLIHMKVMPMTTRTALPRCELWDPESGISAFDIVNQAASTAFPDPILLNRGFSQPVKVSYVYSCNRFYVQLKSKQDDLLRLMLDIQLICRDIDLVNTNMIKVGMPCYALYEGDQQWYRSQIVEVLLGGKVKVRYVDYGNEETVAVTFLKPIEGKQLTILRPQAIECCLNGYQNMEPDLERDNLLEELILEQEFTMKVVEMQNKKALIELIDASNYNVASLLLDKIATTRSQVSPMLVQAGNKIEHRKSSNQFSPKDLPPKQEQRKFDRDQRDVGDTSNEKMGWRKDARGPRNRNSYESNESNESTSWRQNNKGFNKSYDRQKRDDSEDSDRHSNKGFQRNDRNRNDFNSRNTEDSSWRQNDRGFNKSHGRHNRESNKNDEWMTNGGDHKTESKDEWNNVDSNSQDDWGGNVNNNRQSRRDNDDWTSGKDSNRQSYKSRDRNDHGGGGRDFGRPNFKSRDRDDWGGSKDGDSRPFKKKGRDDWNNKENDTSNFGSKDDDWNTSESKQEDHSWGNKTERRGRDNFKKPRERFNEKSDDWNNTEGSYKSDFRKKPDFKREKSELSSSGSEKSFRKGGFNKNKSNFNRKFDKSPRNNFTDDAAGGDSWNLSTPAASVEVPNAAPSTAKFTPMNVENLESDVCISWFHNPAYFYCQLENSENKDKFKTMMEDIQVAYKGRVPSSTSVGAPVIGLFPEDNVLYRAEVLEKVGSQFKVYYVDFGNVSVIDKVWPIEMRFMELPAQAVCCKLDKIEPPSDAWPEASKYSCYFDKTRFFCRFLSTENDKVAVQLEYNGEDIATSLLRDGLAKMTLPASTPELPLLIGQQFKAMLISVNSLGDFSMSLQSGFLINCSIFNLSESTETWEDTLKEKIEQILIVYVDDLKEDRLEVTLYDQNGQKIKLIDRDEAAFESVELLCPYLLQYSTLSGEVAHVEDGTVFIQPSDCAETLEYLLNALYEYYENTTPENPLTPVESYVYAVKGSDSNWYRGRVTAINENKMTVNYLDYGNSEELDVDVLRELIVEFMDIQIMSVPVVIKDANEDLIGQAVVINLNFTESGLEGIIQEQITPIPENIETPTVEQTPAEPTTVEPTTQTDEVVESIGTQVILSHIDSPSDFYLQLASSMDVIEQLQATLQEQISDMPDMENPVIGVLCAAPYSLDQQWYRAQVLDADTDITTVRFVDYGNTDVLDNHTTRVKTLPTHLLALEVHATRCRLKIKPVDDEWTSTASERFEQLCSADVLTAQFISQDEKTNYVELFSNGQNVREVLVQEKLALPDEVVSETSSVGFVSHLNSPSEFWIQLENCVDELEWVAEQLSGAENFPELEDLAPGTLCAALFPDDQMWYRARILSNTVAGIEVLFVDYGNSCTSCSLRELPEDLVMLPPLAQKCSFQKPENLTSWGPEMIRKFGEIAADGQTTFTVKKLSTGETASVILYLDGVDVTTLLLPTTEEVRVKNCESLDELVLIKNGDELPTKYKLEALPDVTWNEDSVKKLEDLSDDGKTVFQAEFVSDDTVRLYLGLNDIRLELNGVKTTTPTSSPMKIRSEKLDSVTHSTENIPGDNFNDIQSIVENVVEASLVHSDVKQLVEGLVGDSVNYLLANNTINTDESSASIASSILTEVVEHCTNIDDQIQNTDSVEALCKDVVIKLVSNVSQDLVDSPVESEACCSMTHDIESICRDVVTEIVGSADAKIDTYPTVNYEVDDDGTQTIESVIENVITEIISSASQETTAPDDTDQLTIYDSIYGPANQIKCYLQNIVNQTTAAIDDEDSAVDLVSNDIGHNFTLSSTECTANTVTDDALAQDTNPIPPSSQFVMKESVVYQNIAPDLIADNVLKSSIKTVTQDTNQALTPNEIKYDSCTNTGEGSFTTHSKEQVTDWSTPIIGDDANVSTIGVAANIDNSITEVQQTVDVFVDVKNGESDGAKEVAGETTKDMSTISKDSAGTLNMETEEDNSQPEVKSVVDLSEATATTTKNDSDSNQVPTERVEGDDPNKISSLEGSDLKSETEFSDADDTNKLSSDSDSNQVPTERVEGDDPNKISSLEGSDLKSEKEFSDPDDTNKLSSPEKSCVPSETKEALPSPSEQLQCSENLPSTEAESGDKEDTKTALK